MVQEIDPVGESGGQTWMKVELEAAGRLEGGQGGGARNGATLLEAVTYPGLASRNVGRWRAPNLPWDGHRVSHRYLARGKARA